MKEATTRHGTVDVLGNEAGVSVSSQVVGGAIRNDLVVSVMSVGYEG